jgi:hypothetical protein
MKDSPSIYERPSRRKSSTVRFGIDDIPLNEALHSPFGKTPKRTKLFSPSASKNVPSSGKWFLKINIRHRMIIESNVDVKNYFLDVSSELEAPNLSASEAEGGQGIL